MKTSRFTEEKIRSAVLATQRLPGRISLSDFGIEHLAFRLYPSLSQIKCVTNVR